MKYLSLILLPTIAAAISSCGPVASPSTPNPNAQKALKAVYLNPHPVGSYAHFKAQKSYPKTRKVYKNKDLLAKTNSSNSKVVINLKQVKKSTKHLQEISVSQRK